MTHMVRIDESLHARLAELAKSEGEPMGVVLAKAVEAYEERAYWAAVNAGYAALRADDAAWEEERSERELWDNALSDGVDDEPYPVTADGLPVPR